MNFIFASLKTSKNMNFIFASLKLQKTSGPELKSRKCPHFTKATPLKNEKEVDIKMKSWQHCF